MKNVALVRGQLFGGGTAFIFCAIIFSARDSLNSTSLNLSKAKDCQPSYLPSVHIIKDPRTGPLCDQGGKATVIPTHTPAASHDPGLAINPVLSISCRFLGLALVNTKRSAVTIDRLHAITE